MRREFRQDRSGRTGGAPALSALTIMLISASLFAPLTSSLILSKGTGSATFTRASSATCWGYAPTANSGDAQVLLVCASGEARFTGARRISQGVWSDYYADGTLIPGSLRLGYLAESAATNLFLNSAVGVTQTTGTLTAASYTLSFYGTGSIVGTGGFVGTLAGTGAANRVSLTVTASALAAVLTVTGSCTEVQLELGSITTSYAPTTSIAVTRDADVLTYTLAGNADNTQGAFYCEVIRPTSETVFSSTCPFMQLSNASGQIGRFNATSETTTVSTFDGTTQAIKSGLSSVTSGQRKRASSWGALGQKATGDGATPATVAFDGAMGPGTGNIIVGTNLNGNIRNIRLWITQLTDAQLVTITS